jgi:hypothetical protein
MHQTYKLIDNRMVLIAQKCLEAARDEETGDTLYDEEEGLIFEEIDCNPSYWFFDIQLQSVGLKTNFQLRMAIYDKDMAGGFVLYKGEKERIPIHLNRSEDIQEGKQFYYNEMYKGEINGVYSFALRGTSIVDNVYYIRKKDGKRFTF